MSFVLHEQAYRQIKAISDRLTRDANAKVVFLVDKNGLLIAASGDVQNIDTTSLASLAAGNIAATGGLAQLIGEREFSNLFHEGDRDNIHITLVDGRVILVIIFDKRSSLGLVRLRVKRASEEVKRVFTEMEKESQASEEASILDEITDDDIDNLFAD
ncbi:MAG TPA: dynein regulation protein LC7 [Myxococcales bacterium]|nr:dynein regulation protein LC7 [Deltaproteobacteria bacterium]MBU47658.1 dynein regulation protein LC7 [Deltaproteobacteria bacterium]HAA58265.1 dynein regulation protein LC7 [Myxococcales bacterium]|tara:strand:- start:19581 stop:20054 length:474 start_codon:yes stop_codon:yes gene_type:complete